MTIIQFALYSFFAALISAFLLVRMHAISFQEA